MIKKTVIWVCGLVFVSAFALSAFADQSIGYRQYFNEGVKAFKEHDDQKALRCFKIAQVYDPSDKELKEYLSILAQRGVVLELQPSQLPAEESIGYRYYFSKATEASQEHKDDEAIRYFKIAKIFNPDSKETDANQAQPARIVSQPAPQQPAAQAIVQTQSNASSLQTQPAAVIPQPAPGVPAAQTAAIVSQPAPAQPAAQAIAQTPSYSSSEQIQQPVTVAPPKAAIYVPVKKANQRAVVLSLAQITNNGQIKPKMQMEFHSSVIIEGKNIKNFIVVDESFLGARIVDTDHLEIDALAIGPTYVHIWDDSGRHTLCVEVVWPQYVTSRKFQAMNGIQHGDPFLVTYTNDWTTYYSGKNIPNLKRQSWSLEQTLAVQGETPYGFFDTSGAYSDFDSISNFDTYTVGLSQIPLEGTSNFNLRGFDALRSLSPLTMPKTTLRGVFADVDLMDDALGISLSHGQEQRPLGFIRVSGSQFLNSYVDALKLTLFPKSKDDQYSFNFATAYGSDRPTYLTDHVYSVEGQHKFNENLTLNAEEGKDGSHDASLANLNWHEGAFRTGLNFRNVDKSYSDISSFPSYQGETGAAWTTDTDFENIKANTFVEAYRDRIYFNPDQPSALNYDANGHLHANMTPDFWSDSDFNYLNNQGEISPITSLGLNQRLSRRFGIGNSLQGTVFGGAGYQSSHTPGSGSADFDRKDVVAGFLLPLTRQISFNTSYEYDWMHRLNPNSNFNPSVIDAGIEYRKQITSKLSFNTQVNYHDELGEKVGDNFGSGEQSVILTTGVNYNPSPNVSIFADSSASTIMSNIGDPPYDDFSLHVGMRIAFGGAVYWDPLGTVSGIVFKDKNGDGRYVPGDEGIGGVKVKVGDKVAITDKDGRYRVQIRAKGVDVVPQLDSIPGGLIFSTPQRLNVHVFQGRTSHADFGLTSQTGIYGIVFVDNNGTGMPGQGDKFIGKVKVILDGNIILKSDPLGAFYFRKVSPGQHTISLDLSSLSINMVPLVKLKNKIDVTEGTNYMFNIPVKVEKASSEEK